MPRKKRQAEFVSNGRCVAYLRVSSDEQARSGHGLMAQRNACWDFSRMLGLQFRKDVHFDMTSTPKTGYFVDAGTSGFSVPLEERPAGKLLFQFMEPGDTLLVHKIDRLTRRMTDFVEICDELTASGIRLVVCAQRIDLGTATGRMFARFIANVAEWESDRKGERIREALSVKKALNLPSPATEHPETVNLPSDWRPTLKHDLREPADQTEGRIFMYTRCSHRDSAESGLGLISQANQLNAYAEYMIKQNPNLKIKDIFIDAAVSAYKVPLYIRPFGRAMHMQLQRGDHVLFASLDRGFRSIRDMAETMAKWEALGVTVHFLKEGISMDDPAGRMMANVIVIFAQMEAELTRDRNREVRAIMAAKGQYCGGAVPTFWKLAKDKKTKQLVLDEYQFFGFRLIQKLRQTMTLRLAMKRCEELLAASDNRPAIPPLGWEYSVARKRGIPLNWKNINGMAKPRFTIDWFVTAIKLYPAAKETWDQVVREAKEAENKKGVEPPPKPRLNDRHWPKGANKPNRGSVKGGLRAAQVRWGWKPPADSAGTT